MKKLILSFSLVLCSLLLFSLFFSSVAQVHAQTCAWYGCSAWDTSCGACNSQGVKFCTHTCTAQNACETGAQSTWSENQDCGGPQATPTPTPLPLTPTPTNSPPKGSVYQAQPAYVDAGSPVSYWGQGTDLDNNLQEVDLYYRSYNNLSLTPTPNPWVIPPFCSVSSLPAGTNTATCPATGLSTFTAAEGLYDVVINAKDNSQGGAFNQATACSGNPDTTSGVPRCSTTGSDRISLYAFTPPSGRVFIKGYDAGNGSATLTQYGHCVTQFNQSNTCDNLHTGTQYYFQGYGSDPTRSNRLQHGWVYITKPNGSTPTWPYSCPGVITSSGFCTLSDSQTFSPTHNTWTSADIPWTPPAVGTYWVVVNAQTTTPYRNNCSGNPNTPTLDPKQWAFCDRTGYAGSTYIREDQLTLQVTLPPPALGGLKMDANSGDVPPAQRSTKYGTSGLRSNDPNITATPGLSASNYYNSLILSPHITNASTGYQLAATAFTSKTSPPLNNTLSELLRSSNYNNTTNGFVLVYANQDTNYTGGPSTATAQGGCGKNFCAGFHYAYYKGQWRLPSTNNTVKLYDSTGEITVIVGDKSTTSDPQFIVTFYKNLGSHTWGTYTYLMYSGGVETSAATGPCNGVTPVPTCTSAWVPFGNSSKNQGVLSTIISSLEKLLAVAHL